LAFKAMDLDSMDSKAKVKAKDLTFNANMETCTELNDLNTK